MKLHEAFAKKTYQVDRFDKELDKMAEELAQKMIGATLHRYPQLRDGDPDDVFFRASNLSRKMHHRIDDFLNRLAYPDAV